MSGAALWAVIPAAGKGRRLQAGGRPKQYLPLAGRSVLEHSLDPFLRHPRIAAVVLVLAADDACWPGLGLSHPRLMIATGGAERADSVRAGLAALAGRAAAQDWVLVHDAARPCLGMNLLDRLIAALAGDEVGGLLALPARDTLKQADADGRVAATLDRSRIWQAQTPQMFRHAALGAALAAAPAADITDEAAAMERAGLRPRLVEGSAENLKITLQEDLALAESILQRRMGAC